jgi:RNA polymerase-binding transcription factor DksA
MAILLLSSIAAETLMKEYREVRSHLLDMLEELDERLGRITDDVRHSDKPLDQDFSEQAVEAENDEVLDALGNVTRAEVEKIKQAISRIDAGTYGICLLCGEPNKKERLAALPYANYCIKCAERSEHK